MKYIKPTPMSPAYALQGLKVFKLDIPKLPDIDYRLSKIVDGVLQIPKAGEVALIWRKWWDEKDGMRINEEVGLSLCIGRGIRDWFQTSVLRQVTDYGSFLIFKTSSGSLYLLEPQGEGLLEPDAETFASFKKMRGI